MTISIVVGETQQKQPSQSIESQRLAVLKGKVMTAFKIIQALFSILDRIVKYFADRELISLGESKAIAQMHQDAAERVTKALQAREAVESALDANPARVRDWDQDRRD